MQPNGIHLEQITKLVNEGICHPVVDSVWRLEDYKEAFERADVDTRWVKRFLT